MDIIIVVIILVALAAGVFYFRNRQQSGVGEASQPSVPSPQRRRELAQERATVTLDTISPGDALVFWDGTDAITESVLDCREQVGVRTVTWRWVILDNGWVIESSSDGRFLYTTTTVFSQGSWEFEHLTADIERDGVLRTFEERVREGRSAEEPVHFSYQDVLYQVRNTGTFTATPAGGKETSQPVWRDITTDPSDNVYVGLATPDDESALVIWTTHVALLQGRELHDTDIRGIYGA